MYECECAAGGRSAVRTEKFFRNLVAAFLRQLFLSKIIQHLRWKKTQCGSLFLRCAFGTLGILCNFYAIDHLLVADASILNKLSPFCNYFFLPVIKRKDKTSSGNVRYTGICRLFVCGKTGV